MKAAAVGVRMHSGWGAIVAVSNDGGRLSVVDRRRIEVIDEKKSTGKKQPYHFAKNLALGSAEKYIANCAVDSERLASEVIRSLMDELRDSGYAVRTCAIVLASGRPLPSLSEILASHPLIHTAEGEFFRRAVWNACEKLKIEVSGVRERDLGTQAKSVLGKSAAAAVKKISQMGKSLGSPWTQDHKSAALAAWIALHEKGARRPVSPE
ncbi:MAG TPA: hypothetical protein VGR39_02755 [Candidatus Acidoferrales bacterium]|nr:hypothetical protein [Candidatus Acidoferrales bacterium]